MFGHLGNAADSLNAVIYVQCKVPCTLENKERARIWGHLKCGPEGSRPLTPASLEANESCACSLPRWLASKSSVTAVS